MPDLEPVTEAALERLALLDEAAARHVDEQRPPNTLKAYAQDWQVWQDYTAEAGIPPLSATIGALTGFVVWLERGRTLRPDERAVPEVPERAAPAAPSTIERRLTGALAGLRHHKVVVDPEASRAAWRALKGYRQRLAREGIQRGRGKATMVTLADLRAMSRACPDTLAGARDRAMLLIGFPIAARCSDLANLLVTDVQPVDDRGLAVTVRHGKSTGDMVVPRRENADTDPVRAWFAWRSGAGITEGPAFRRVDRHGNVGEPALSTTGVNQILTRAGVRAGLPYPVTGHSLRSGFATEARRAGADDLAIADQGRWVRGSRALYEYIRRVDQWNDNAAGALDL
ncbi:site-specific integrase [Amycolatopsis sp.]|uniref:site-specific integrase n=1 Tax=Amycolatopsis sp. TaxID=37632 RepID=UPI002D7FA302|nr:site-specific integrase [Amycolatopsis sp.]HET6710073.1 site-specific integrase [Amycolatopsis sp.]